MNPIIYPPKLKLGDHIRVIAPARSLSLLSQDTIDVAMQRLEQLGFTISFGKHVEECDEFASSPVTSRIEDLHAAFRDPKVNGIFTVIGGYNSNQLLNYIDYELIKNNPKILCGFSDITVLSNAIFAKTGVVGYSGPHFSSWAMKYGFEYTEEFFEKCCMTDEPFTLYPSPEWSDDPWYVDQKNRNFRKNEGYWILNEGEGEGVLFGGHLPCLGASQGTAYFPSLKEDSMLFIEIDEEFTIGVFDRLLQSIIQQPIFSYIRGLVIGRFQRNAKMTKILLETIIKNKPEFARIPIIANVDFGHTTPFITFPIGGTMIMNTSKEDCISIKNH